MKTKKELVLLIYQKEEKTMIKKEKVINNFPLFMQYSWIKSTF